MEQGYEVYSLADEHFYDSPLLPSSGDVAFDAATRPAPEGWMRLDTDDWAQYAPRDIKLPAQGWKIHASACLDNAEDILDIVWDYCVPRRIAFKFIRSRRLLFLRNAKYADRGLSGKFVTIYPDSEDQLETVLRELDELLQGRSGPYILSDLRWGKGPLFVRYGGFAQRYCTGAHGERLAAIQDGVGELVPDKREAAFSLPDWVSMPDCLVPQLDARNSVSVENLPYRIERALHFSNGGGVYGGVDKLTDEPVVLKEARPHAGLTRDGIDAVTRLERERDMLERLAGLDAVPALRDYFPVDDHRFLVMDFVEGSTLNELIVKRYPTSFASDEPAVAEYAAWALEIIDRVERAVHAVHDRGVVLGDLQPANVLVGPDGRVVLIDLEGGSEASTAGHQRLAASGFVAPRACTGMDVDRYALACLRLSIFLPLTALVERDPAKAPELATEIGTLFGVPQAWLTAALDVIAAANEPARLATARPLRLEPSPAGWECARSSMTRAILTSATPQRADRLFPGDIKQFDTNGLNIAYGAAGVLYALSATGAGRFPEHEQWLVEHAIDSSAAHLTGFYDGLHGVAFVLDHLDRREDAFDVLELAQSNVDGREETLGLDLFGGLAGIGLNLAHFAAATDDRALWEAALRVADLIAERLGDEDDVETVSGGEHPHAGLTRGSSGPALFFLRLYERFGEATLLDLAATAIRQDLHRCIVRENSGTMEVDEGWRTMPYLADGSAGIGLVIDDYLVHRKDEQFAPAASAIRRAAECAFYIQSGLFWGRAGMLLFHGRARGTSAERDAVIAEHVRRLNWHALTYEGHLTFPGERLLRLSMDVATGTAGVLLALGTALHDDPVHLPFLPSLQAGVVSLPADLQLTERR
ncbi:MAG: putative SapB synthase [Solirubrobacteraceae bacterium]|nr:putative SapB synthase [Solirubrobacteraceae bacterium]